MLGYLEGKVLHSDGKKAILLTSSGVGYEINFAYLIAEESETSVYIHHHVSENDQSLWGFKTFEEKKMFELLKTVNKVGSSKAYPLVTQVGVKELIQAIALEQVEVLTKAQGIGKKMAEQIILSLKDKIEKVDLFKAQTSKVPKSEDAAQLDGVIFQEALQALASLGYKDKQVSSVLNSKYNDSIRSSAELIKLALREL